MKELTIEQKAKAYDEALEKAKNCYSITTPVADTELIELIFPELKESKEERIIKAIKSAVLQLTDIYLQEKYGLKQSDCIAWLENQGKHDMGISEATKQELENNLYKALEKETPESCNEFLEKQGEQKPTIVPKFRVGDTIKNKKTNKIFTISDYSLLYEYYHDINHYHEIKFSEQDDWELVEQKLADKTEQKFKVGDYIKPIDKCLGSPRIIEEVCDGWYVTDKGTLYFEFEDNWELVEKPIWSEEDEEIYKKVKTAIYSYYAPFSRDAEEMSEWFKNLKDRYTWRPSDKQMEALKTSYLYWKGATKEVPYTEGLESLYEQLKKL